MEKVKLGFIGAGRRAQFFLKIAGELKDTYQIAGAVTARRESGEEFSRKYEAPSYLSIDEMVDKVKPDILLNMVDREHKIEVMLGLMDYNLPILCETPAGETLKELQTVWKSAKEKSAKIEISEQYIFKPLQQVCFELIRKGLLGDIHYANVSIAHGYHGVSLIRNYLGAGLDSPEILTIANEERTEWEKTPKGHTVSIFKYPGQKKMGILDWAGQYKDPIRSLSLIIRGSRGEINQNTARFYSPAKKGAVVCLPIMRDSAGTGRSLEALFHKSVYCGEYAVWDNPFTPAGFSDEEIGIAYCLESIRRHTQLGEPLKYGLKQALQDQYLALLSAEAVEKKGIIKAEPQPWCE